MDVDGANKIDYYVIYFVASKDNKDRLFPTTFNNKAKSDDLIKALSKNPLSASKKYFPNDDNVKLFPFLYFRKTLITKDFIQSDDHMLDESEGTLVSNMIPVDYVSEIYLSTNMENSILSDRIKILINEASRGF